MIATRTTALLIGTCITTSVSGFVQRAPSSGGHFSRIYNSEQFSSLTARDGAGGSIEDSSFLLNDKSKGLVGKWEELEGNYILKPSVDTGPPRALLHFLGGAIVGAAPHATYRYMLERLCDKGYLIVATPYNLSFDHLDTCDSIIQRFERIAPKLARQYGAIPVVGVGHSCGSLLQLLITSVFPDTPRAANALMSFNNKPVKEAVPFFEEVFAPIFTALGSSGGDNVSTKSSSRGLALGLQLLRSASEGELPSDALLDKISKFATPFENNFAPTIPSPVREAFRTVAGPTASALSQIGALQLTNQIVDTLDQIPLLIDEVADGTRAITPSSESVKSAVRRAYRARQTLILKFEDDPIDESDEIENLLKEAESVARMKRPMVGFDVQRATLPGNHATPLFAPPLEFASRAEDLLGKEAARDNLLYAQADATVDELSRWLENECSL